MDKFGIVILAAGQGTRLKLELAKPLVPLRGKRLIDYALQASYQFMKKNGQGRIGVVVGHQREKVIAALGEKYIDLPLTYAVQEKQLGTADAVRAYFKDCTFADKCEWTLVMCADTPMISADVLDAFWQKISTGPFKGAAATFQTAKPKGYGRIVRASRGFKIVEEKDATIEERKIQEVNSGLYFIKTDFLITQLAKVGSENKSGEFYLTDVFAQNESVEAVLFEDEKLFLGVNNLVQLSEAGRYLNNAKCEQLMLSGVMMVAPEQIYIEDDVEVGAESILYGPSYFFGSTKIGKGCSVEAYTTIKNSKLADRVEILAGSHLEEAVVGERSTVGPMARLRPGTVLEKKVKIGNFVELKKAHLKDEAKVSHLSYVGDAEIGERSNLGCGFITCNYDGVNKHFTRIGQDCFVGSDTQIIAPVTIGDQCFIAAGSTITHSVESGAFAVARTRQETKPGLAKRFLKKKDS